MSPDLNPALLSRRLAPLDKRAFGVAIGLVGALMIGGATVLSLVIDPGQRVPLSLLSNFFIGYEVSGSGAFIGAAWGFVTGFVWGWFFAFVRNLVIAVWMLWVRVRVDVATSQDVLDHI